MEEFHKSLTALAKSPTKMEQSQSNHIVASLLAFVRLERLKVKERLKTQTRLYQKMIRAAFEELQRLKAA